MKFSISTSERAASFLHDASPLVALEVELDRALAAIGAVEIGGVEMAAVGRLDEWRSPAAGIVAGALALDLDHVGAKIGEDLPGPWTGENSGQSSTRKPVNGPGMNVSLRAAAGRRDDGRPRRPLSDPASANCLYLVQFCACHPGSPSLALLRPVDGPIR